MFYQYYNLNIVMLRLEYFKGFFYIHVIAKYKPIMENIVICYTSSHRLISS